LRGIALPRAVQQPLRATQQLSADSATALLGEVTRLRCCSPCIQRMITDPGGAGCRCACTPAALPRRMAPPLSSTWCAAPIPCTQRRTRPAHCEPAFPTANVRFVDAGAGDRTARASSSQDALLETVERHRLATRRSAGFACHGTIRADSATALRYDLTRPYEQALPPSADHSDIQAASANLGLAAAIESQAAGAAGSNCSRAE
jgi:hypothetical protein